VGTYFVLLEGVAVEFAGVLCGVDIGECVDHRVDFEGFVRVLFVRFVDDVVFCVR
jgi:hypothetical protein